MPYRFFYLHDFRTKDCPKVLALCLGQSEASYCPSPGRISWGGDDAWGDGDGGVPPSGEVHQPTALQTDSVATLTQPWWWFWSFSYDDHVRRLKNIEDFWKFTKKLTDGIYPGKKVYTTFQGMFLILDFNNSYNWSTVDVWSYNLNKSCRL